MSSTTSQRSRAIFSEKKSHKRGLLGPFEVEMWGAWGMTTGKKTKNHQRGLLGPFEVRLALRQVMLVQMSAWSPTLKTKYIILHFFFW